MREMRFETLPFVGARPVKVRFCGNGKDAELTLEAEGNRKTTVPVDDVGLNVSGEITTITRGWGDTAIIWEIAPRPEQRVTIEDATIGFPPLNYPGDSEDLGEALREYERTGTLTRTVMFHLKLKARN